MERLDFLVYISQVGKSRKPGKLYRTMRRDLFARWLWMRCFIKKRSHGKIMESDQVVTDWKLVHAPQQHQMQTLERGEGGGGGKDPRWEQWSLVWPPLSCLVFLVSHHVSVGLRWNGRGRKRWKKLLWSADRERGRCHEIKESGDSRRDSDMMNLVFFFDNFSLKRINPVKIIALNAHSSSVMWCCLTVFWNLFNNFVGF